MLSFADYYQDSRVTINAMHPGAVKTDTGQENGAIYKWYKKRILDKTLRPANISAEAIYYLAVSRDIETVNGKFFNLTTLEEPTPPALDMEVARLLWDISVTMGKLD
jgi:NAD(P)-dependent dehydrogenase (short-subunit alcohol dehydrogenase family)